MAAVGGVTVNVVVGTDLEAAIRKIVRSEIHEAADNGAYYTDNTCTAAALFALAHQLELD